MTDYTKSVDFAAKDALPTQNAGKVIKGTEIGDEFDDIATAIATKFDSAADLPIATESAVGVFELATVTEAQALTVNDKYITPHTLADVLNANAGLLGDWQALSDAGADTLAGWDDSASAGIQFTFGDGIETSTTAIQLDIKTGPIVIDTAELDFDISSLSSLTGAGLAGADLFYIDDGGAGTGKSIAYQDLGVPVSNKTDNFEPDITEANVFYTISHASADKVFTIPANGAVAYPVGTTFSVMRLSASDEVSIAVTTDTARAPNGAKCANQYSVITAIKIASTTWVIMGDTKV